MKTKDDFSTKGILETEIKLRRWIGDVVKVHVNAKQKNKRFQK